MNREVRDKWVAALRSGQYQQAQRRLRTDEAYCCLGVLCDISGLGEWKLWFKLRQRTHFAYNCGPDFNHLVLPDSVAAWAEVGPDPKAGTKFLSSENDGGKTFQEIADLIELYL